jgi:predicted dehydrogenase
MFYDASGHQLDSLMWVTGLRGENVWAHMDNRGTPNVMFTRGHATLTGGVPLTFTFVGDAHKWREQINIHCEGTDFVIENGRAFYCRDNRLEPLAEQDEAETADEAFVQLVRGEGPNWAPPSDVWPVLTLTNAALESARTGRETAVSVQS